MGGCKRIMIINVHTHFSEEQLLAVFYNLGGPDQDRAIYICTYICVYIYIYSWEGPDSGGAMHGLCLQPAPPSAATVCRSRTGIWSLLFVVSMHGASIKHAVNTSQWSRIYIFLNNNNKNNKRSEDSKLIYPKCKLIINGWYIYLIRSKWNAYSPGLSVTSHHEARGIFNIFIVFLQWVFRVFCLLTLTSWIKFYSTMSGMSMIWI